MNIDNCTGKNLISVTKKGQHLVVDIHCHLNVSAADKIVQLDYPGPPPGIYEFSSDKTNEVNRAQFCSIGAPEYAMLKSQAGYFPV